MGAMQRTKGATAERTLVNLFKEHGFNDAMRNHAQTAVGGFDIIGVGDFAIECKNHKKLNINGWWQQTTAQATEGLIPTLIYHIPNTSRWLVQIPISVINETYPKDMVMTVDFEDFIYIAREVIA